MVTDVVDVCASTNAIVALQANYECVVQVLDEELCKSVHRKLKLVIKHFGESGSDAHVQTKAT